MSSPTPPPRPGPAYRGQVSAPLSPAAFAAQISDLASGGHPRNRPARITDRDADGKDLSATVTYVVPEELKAMLDRDAGKTSSADVVAASLARILERHEQIVRDQVARETKAPGGRVAEHALEFYAYPSPVAVRRAHYFGAVCACSWSTGLNTLKWVLLDIQTHMIEHGFAGERDALADTHELTRTYENARARLDLARRALVEDGYFTEDEVDDDIAPRIGELCSHMRRQLDQGMPAPLLEALDQLRVQVRAAMPEREWDPDEQDAQEPGAGA